jgi:hypothetical protein
MPFAEVLKLLAPCWMVTLWLLPLTGAVTV